MAARIWHRACLAARPRVRNDRRANHHSIGGEKMKKLILGSVMAAAVFVALAPQSSRAEPVNGGHCNDWGDGDTGGCVVGGGGGGYGTGAGGGGAGDKTCYNWVGPNASCQTQALGYFYSNCSSNCF
jgi:hypothetical protein